MIWVIGKRGYVAQRLLKTLAQGGYEFCATSSSGEKKNNFDLLHPKKFNYEAVERGDMVIFLAAISSPDVCTNEFDYAYRVNVTGTKYFINKCLDREAKVIFFSSDTVYGNTIEQVVETSDVNPCGTYAEMKLEVESEFEGEERFKVMRLSYVFSRTDKYMHYLTMCSGTKNKAEVFHPLNRRVVYIEDVVNGIISLYENWRDMPYSIVNACGPELLSRLDIAQIYKSNSARTLVWDVVTPPDDFFLARPKVIDMGSICFERVLGRHTVNIKDAMANEFKTAME